jgi:hypothetical protein
MTNYHIIKVIPVPETETKPAKVKIVSELFGAPAIVISYTDRDAISTAAKHLEANGFNLIGGGEGQLNAMKRVKTMYIITDTFKPLVKQ